MPSPPSTSLAKNATYLAAARLLPRLLRVMYVIVVARFLGSELYGLFAYGQSYYLSLLPATTFGLQLRITKDIGINRDSARRTLAQTLAFQTGVAVAAALLSIGTAQLTEADPTVRHLLLIFSFALLARAIINWTQHVFVAFESTHYALQFEVYFRPLEIIAGMLIVMAGGKLLAVALAHALVWWIHVIVALTVIHKRLAPVGFACNWSSAKALLRFGWPLSLNVFCTGFLVQGPIILYRHLAPHAPHIGQIAVPLQALTILSILPAAITASSLPTLARSVHRQDGAYLHFSQAMIRLSYGFGAIAGLIGLSLGSELITRFLGADYALAGTLFGPALWLVIPYACGSVLSSIHMIRDRTQIVLVCSGVSVVVLLLTMPLLTRWLHDFGVIAATAVALLCWMLSTTVTCKLTGECSLTESLFRPTLWVLVTVAAYAATAPIHNVFALGVSVCVLLLSAPILGVVTPREMKKVRARLRFHPRDKTV